MPKSSFHYELKQIIDEFVTSVYLATKTFPKEELFGVTSQIRRAALSVALNYTEGFARQRSATNRQFLEIAYGSLKETDYLIRFSTKQTYLTTEIETKLLALSNRIGAMLWSTIQLKKRTA